MITHCFSLPLKKNSSHKNVDIYLSVTKDFFKQIFSTIKLKTDTEEKKLRTKIIVVAS